MKKGTILILIVFCASVVKGQSSISDTVNRRLLHKNHLGAQLGGPSFLSINYEHFFNEHWSIEAGAGSILAISGIHAQGRYYLGSKAKPTKFAPYLGVAMGAASIIGGGSSGGINGYGAAVGYVPIGIQWMTKKGSAISIEVAGMYLDNELLPMGAIRLYSSLQPHSRQASQRNRELELRKASYKKTGRYRFGLNVGSLIKPGFLLQGKPDFYFSSNANADVFFQKDIREKFALRIPLRIGFNAAFNWQSKVNEVMYRSGNKLIIGDLGIEPLWNFYRKNKGVGYFAASFVGGIGRKVDKVLIGNQSSGDYQYQSSGGAYPYVKFGGSLGAQWNLSPCILLGLEYGFYVANNVQYPGSWDSSFEPFYKGISGKYFVIYRWGKK